MLRSRLLFATAAVTLVPVAAAPAAESPERAAERAIAQGLDAHRAAHGLPSLRPRARLAHAARRHSARQLRRDRLGHDAGPRQPFARRAARISGAGAVGEVIAFLPAGTRDPAAAALEAWRASPTHAAVLTDAQWGRMGVGVRRGLLGDRRGLVVTVLVAQPAVSARA